MNLEVKNLNIKYNEKYLLQDINLSISSQNITALLGKSGSGKSLISMYLQGFLASNLKASGSVYVDGEIYKTSSRIFAPILQNPSSCFNPVFDIKSHFKESLAKYDESRIIEILDSMDVDKGVLEEYPFRLSGGTLQRIMIAIGIYMKKKCIIADEPTSDVDWDMAKSIIEQMISLARHNDIALLIITHNLEHIAKLVDIICVIEDGRLVDNISASSTQAKTTIGKAILKLRN